jgi:hypothetical protein
MPDEASVSPSWEYYVDPNSLLPSGSNPISPNLSQTPPTNDSAFSTNSLPSPPPRSSSESVGRTSSSKWRESVGQSTLERRGTVTTITTNPEVPNVVEPSFDENLLRMLCELDVSRLLVREDWCLTLRTSGSSAPSRCYWTGSSRVQRRVKCVA